VKALVVEDIPTASHGLVIGTNAVLNV